MTEQQKAHADIKHLQLLGNNALIINILFFVVLFVGFLLEIIAGFLPAVLFVGISFMLSIIYLNHKKKNKKK